MPPPELFPPKEKGCESHCLASLLVGLTCGRITCWQSPTPKRPGSRNEALPPSRARPRPTPPTAGPLSCPPTTSPPRTPLCWIPEGARRGPTTGATPRHRRVGWWLRLATGASTTMSPVGKWRRPLLFSHEVGWVLWVTRG